MANILEMVILIITNNSIFKDEHCIGVNQPWGKKIIDLDEQTIFTGSFFK